MSPNLIWISVYGFEHRTRNDAEFSEKWAYIRGNPMRKGLVGDADGWRHWVGFDPREGRELGWEACGRVGAMKEMETNR